MMDGQQELIWRKSQACAASACVEVARSGADFLVRDSEDPDGHRLSFGAAEWSAFIGALRRGDQASYLVERD